MSMLLIDTAIPVYIAVAVIMVVGLGCLIYKISRSIKIKKTGIEEVKHVRYTADDEITVAGEANVTYNTGDILIAQNEEQIAGVKNRVKPGKYVILSTVEGEDKVNVRLGQYVREFEHGTNIVLAEGETICPVSGSIILR